MSLRECLNATGPVFRRDYKSFLILAAVMVLLGALSTLICEALFGTSNVFAYFVMNMAETANPSSIASTTPMFPEYTIYLNPETYSHINIGSVFLYVIIRAVFDLPLTFITCLITVKALRLLTGSQYTIKQATGEILARLPAFFFTWLLLITVSLMFDALFSILSPIPLQAIPLILFQPANVWLGVLLLCVAGILMLIYIMGSMYVFCFVYAEGRSGFSALKASILFMSTRKQITFTVLVISSFLMSMILAMFIFTTTSQNYLSIATVIGLFIVNIITLITTTAYCVIYGDSAFKRKN